MSRLRLIATAAFWRWSRSALGGDRPKRCEDPRSSGRRGLWGRNASPRKGSGNPAQFRIRPVEGIGMGWGGEGKPRRGVDRLAARARAARPRKGDRPRPSRFNAWPN